MRIHTAVFTAIMVLFVSGARSQTDIYLKAERSGRGRIPVVVDDFEADPGQPDQVARYVNAVLDRDLILSGLFETLRFEERSDTLPEGKTAAAVVEGALWKNEDKYMLEARLLDFSSREVIFRKRYNFRRDARRSVAHHLCDEIAFFLVGERGIATTRILFCRSEGGVKSLFMIDYDGFGERRFTENELVVSPLWLDENRFCFTSFRRENPDCYIVDLKQGKRSFLSHRKGINIAGSYFGEQDRIAITLSVKGNSEIYLIDSNGEIVKRLTRNRAIECSPSWSPGGRELAFVSDRTGAPQVYIMDEFGGSVRRLTRSGSYNTSPAWSPAGDMITYVSRDGWLYRLKLISPDGLVEENLFDDYLSYEDPCWAPDGRHIAATVRYGGEPWIVIVNIDTGEKRRLIQGESSSWSPLPTAEPD